MTAFTCFSPSLSKEITDHADNPRKKKATRKRGRGWAFQWCTPMAHTWSFARAVLSGANRKKSTPAWISRSPARIVVSCCCRCLVAAFTFPPRHFERLSDHAGNPSKKRRRGSVALTGLSNGLLQRRTRGRLLVPFSLVQTAAKKSTCLCIVLACAQQADIRIA